jgi:hypothetical protein
MPTGLRKMRRKSMSNKDEFPIHGGEDPCFSDHGFPTSHNAQFMTIAILSAAALRFALSVALSYRRQSQVRAPTDFRTGTADQ